MSASGDGGDARATSGTAAISVHDVSFAYAGRDGERRAIDRRAIDRVTFDVTAAEFVALIGANGTGKSTLLRLIGGLLAPTGGHVSIRGQTVSEPSPTVGVVFQEPRLLPWRSTLDNVAFPLELAAWPVARRRERAREMLRLVGLLDVDALRPHQLSGGMRQRASIARALTLEPAVLLLDEPFSALDALTRERFNLELQEIWQTTGTTVLLVTHSIAEAIFLADRVIVLAGQPGRLAAEVRIPLARPRTTTDLDAAEVSEIASEIRSHLGSDAVPIGSAGETA